MWRYFGLALLFALGPPMVIRAASSVAGESVRLMKVYHYDDLDECRRMYDDYVYCVTKARLETEMAGLAQRWDVVQSYSDDPRHFDRRLLEIGTCMQRCESYGSFPHGPSNLTINVCVKAKIDRLYQLNASLGEMVCVDAGTGTDIGFVEYAFIGTAAAILLTVIVCTVLDTRRAKPRPTTQMDIVAAFSLPRNLASLVQYDTGRPRSVNLHHLDGVRALTMLVIILCHASIPLLRFPLKNVEQLEERFGSYWFPIAMAGNTYTVQLFFVIGGMLLSVNVLQHMTQQNEFRLSYLWKRLVNRLIRILPLYAFMVFFHYSWYQRMQDGPVAIRYEDHCRKYWWTNILFINNYIDPGKPCIQFSWYLGADFQLFLAGTLTMMLMWRYPQSKGFFLWAMVVSTFVVPTAIIYIYNLDATVMMILRHVLQEIRDLEYYQKVYITCESNAGNYFVGMITGIVYYNVKDDPKASQQLPMRVLLTGCGLFFVVTNTLTVLLPKNHLDERSLLLACYGSLLKFSWGIFPAVLLLYLALNHRTSMVASILQHPILRVAAKLSYAVYLVQYAIIYTFYRNVTSYPLVYSAFTIMLFTSAILGVSFAVGFLLHVTIELPFMNLLKPTTLDARNHKPVQVETAAKTRGVS